MSEPAADTREALRREWLENASSVFDRLFPEGDQPCPALDALERRSVQLSRDLASWLLERRIAAAPEARPEQPALCPRCGRPGVRATPDGPLPRRVVTTEAGDVEVARERWRCPACRAVFFPPG
jgi:hypothetical protein